MERLWRLLLAGLLAAGGVVVLGVPPGTLAPGTVQGCPPPAWCTVPGFALSGHNFSSVPGAAGHRACWSACQSHPLCLSANYGSPDRCQLNNATHEDNGGDFHQANGWVYTHSQKSCGYESAQGTTAEIIEEPVPTYIGLLCPSDCGNFTRDASAAVPVHWYPSESFFKRLNADGSIDYTWAQHRECRDDAGAVVQSGDVFPAGTRLNVTCRATPPDAHVQLQCSFGIVLIVCSTCGPLGMESGDIGDEQITANGILDGNDTLYGPRLARPNSSGWCADRGGRWIQVDFDHAVDIYGMILQPHAVSGTVIAVEVLYSDDNEAWTLFTDAYGGSRPLHGPDFSGMRFVTFQSPTFSKIHASHIRVTLWYYYVGVRKCLRLELIGSRGRMNSTGSE